MGSRLAAAAFAFVAAHNERAREEGGRELESLEVALLALMGLTAIDNDPDPAFWVKRTEICAQLGIRDTEAGRKRIQRAVSALSAAGAITVPGKYQRGHTPRYRLIYQGGCSASTPSDEVWTPGIPRTEPRGMPSVQGYGRLASPSVDAEHPPEEGRGTKEEERARDTADEAPFELAPPPQDPEPEPETRPTSPYCDRHPNGTGQPCYACGVARKRHTAAERSDRARRKPRPPTMVTRHGRRVHADPADHIVMPNGTCRDCEAHPDDIAVTLETRQPVGAAS